MHHFHNLPFSKIINNTLCNSLFKQNDISNKNSANRKKTLVYNNLRANSLMIIANQCNAENTSLHFTHRFLSVKIRVPGHHQKFHAREVPAY